MAGRILVIRVDKQRDEITLTCLLFFLSLFHRLDESLVALVVGQRLNDIGNTDFEDNVHTALQVKAETDLGLQTLLIGINTQILHRVLVVLLCDGILNLGCLTVVVVCGY